MKTLILTITILMTTLSAAQASYSENTCIRKYNELNDKIKQAILDGKTGRTFNDCTRQLDYYGSDVCASIAQVERKVLRKYKQMKQAKWDLYDYADEARKLGYMTKCGDYDEVDRNLSRLQRYAEKEFDKMHSREVITNSGGLDRAHWEKGEYIKTLEYCEEDLKEEKYRNHCQ